MILAALSGLAIGLLGVFLLLVRPQRGPRIAFAVFLIFWAGFILAGDAGRWALDAGEIGLAEDAFLVHLSFLVVIYLPLVHFGRTYLAPDREARAVPYAVAVATPALVGGGLLLWRPSSFLVGIQDGAVVYGDARIVYILLLLLGLYFATASLARRTRGEQRALPADQLSYAAHALVPYVAYVTGDVAVRTLWGSLEAGSLWVSLDHALLGATAWLGLPVLGASYRWLTSGPEEHRALPRAFTSVVFLVPFAFGILSAISLLTALPDLETTGLWRLVSVVLIVYAIARYELFDIEVRIKRGTMITAGVGGMIVVAIGVEQGLEALTGSPGLSVILTLAAGIIALGYALPRSSTVTGWVSERVLPRIESPSRLDERRLEVYEAALVQAQQESGIEAGEPYLSELRQQLGITGNEHAVLARLVRAAGQAPAPDPAPFEEGARVGGRYRLEALMGEGAQGITFRAQDEVLERPVVLKALATPDVPEDVWTRTFLREARLAARIEHPNVVRIYDFGAEGGRPYMVMELVEDGTLQRRLHEEGPLDPEEAVGVLDDVLQGLAHIHDRNVVHRDLKPANILLDQTGTARITDFGIATAMDAEATQDPRTSDQVVPGTPATMSPEVVRGEAPGPSSDIYAAGAVLYHVLAGHTYVDLEGKGPYEMRRTILDQPPREPEREVPQGLFGVGLGALEKAPEDRYESADAMRRALAQAAPRARPA